LPVAHLTYDQYVALTLNRRLGAATKAKAVATGVRAAEGGQPPPEFFDVFQDDERQARQDEDESMLRAAIKRAERAR
jgi:hypothetical protein